MQHGLPRRHVAGEPVGTLPAVARPTPGTCRRRLVVGRGGIWLASQPKPQRINTTPTMRRMPLLTHRRPEKSLGAWKGEAAIDRRVQQTPCNRWAGCCGTPSPGTASLLPAGSCLNAGAEPPGVAGGDSATRQRLLALLLWPPYSSYASNVAHGRPIGMSRPSCGPGCRR